MRLSSSTSAPHHASRTLWASAMTEGSSSSGSRETASASSRRRWRRSTSRACSAAARGMSAQVSGTPRTAAEAATGGGSLQEPNDRAEPLRVKQSWPPLVDAPAPASTSAQSGTSPRRSIGMAWRFVAIPRAVLGAALLALVMWISDEKSDPGATRPAKSDGKAHLTMAQYASGAGITYRAPDHAFSIALPAAPKDSSASKHVHRLVASWSEPSFVEVY